MAQDPTRDAHLRDRMRPWALAGLIGAGGILVGDAGHIPWLAALGDAIALGAGAVTVWTALQRML